MTPLSHQANLRHYKLIDTFFENTSFIGRNYNNFKVGRDLYMSPELFNAFKKKTNENQLASHIDEAKCDAFSLGMTILEVGTMVGIQDCYMGETFNENKLNLHLDEFNMQYADNQMLLEAMTHLLDMNSQTRWDLITLRSELPPEDQIRQYFENIREKHGIVEDQIHSSAYDNTNIHHSSNQPITQIHQSQNPLTYNPHGSSENAYAQQQSMNHTRPSHHTQPNIQGHQPMVVHESLVGSGGFHHQPNIQGRQPMVVHESLVGSGGFHHQPVNQSGGVHQSMHETGGKNILMSGVGIGGLSGINQSQGYHSSNPYTNTRQEVTVQTPLNHYANEEHKMEYPRTNGPAHHNFSSYVEPTPNPQYSHMMVSSNIDKYKAPKYSNHPGIMVTPCSEVKLTESQQRVIDEPIAVHSTFVDDSNIQDWRRADTLPKTSGMMHSQFNPGPNNTQQSNYYTAAPAKMVVGMVNRNQGVFSSGVNQTPVTQTMRYSNTSGVNTTKQAMPIVVSSGVNNSGYGRDPYANHQSQVINQAAPQRQVVEQVSVQRNVNNSSNISSNNYYTTVSGNTSGGLQRGSHRQ